MRRLRLERLEPRYALTTGELDPTFGEGGIVVTDFEERYPADDRAHLIAHQADGKILVAGYTGLGHGKVFSISRLHADGQVDPSFGENGVVLTPFGGDAVPTALAIQPDGKILLAESSSRFVRYLTNGTVDTTFGVQGKSLDHATEFWVQDLSVQPDGKILAAVTALGGVGASVVRLETNGQLDQSFGSHSLTNFPTDGAQLALQPDGKFFVASTYRTYDPTTASQLRHLVISRFAGSGEIDTSFSGDGTLTTPVTGPSGYGLSNLEIEVQSDSKLVVATTSTWNQQDLPTLLRFNGDGTPDASFGGNGVVPLVGMENGQNFVAGLHIQADDRIVVSNLSLLDGTGSWNPHYYISRRLSDGSADTSWDDDGTAVIQLLNQQMSGLALAEEGGVLVAGYQHTGTAADFAVWSYDAIGQPNPQFDDDGLSRVDSAVSSTMVFSSAVKALPDGRVVTASMTYEAGWVFQRYLSTGELDPTFGAGGMRRLRDIDPILDLSFDFARFVDWTVQPDGSLILCLRSPDAEYRMQIRLLRLFEDGSQDLAYGQDGAALLKADGVSFVPQRVSADEFGNVLLAGYLYDHDNTLSTDPTPRFVFRFDSDGKTDNSYGEQGLVLVADEQASLHMLPLTPFISEMGEVGFFDPGWNDAGRDMLVRRLDRDGNIAGEVRLSLPNPAGALGLYITGLSFLPDGRYQAAGRASFTDELGWEVSQPLIQRFSAGGNLEIDFGSEGSALGEIETDYFTTLEVLTRQDGTVWIVMEATDRHFADSSTYVTQITPTGSIDRTFGDNGVLRVDLNEYWERFTTAALTPDGIYLAGTTQDGVSSNGLLARVAIEASPTPWQNPANPLNVSGDAEGTIAPIDALLIINALNDTAAGGARQLGPRDSSATSFFDVNGDGWVTAIDALMVINWLNRNPVQFSAMGTAGEGEGETELFSADDAQSSLDHTQLDAMAIAWLVGGDDTKPARRR